MRSALDIGMTCHWAGLGRVILAVSSLLWSAPVLAERERSDNLYVVTKSVADQGLASRQAAATEALLKKYFHIFDTETRELEAIHNPLTIFAKLIYDDDKTDYDNFDISPYHNKFVKLVVVNKKNNEMFDRLLEKLYHKITVHELKILEDYSDLNANLVSDDVVEGTEDTMSLVNNYVDQLPVDLDKDKLKNMIKETFIEAQDTDVAAE